MPIGALNSDYSTKAKSPLTCEETTYVLGDGFVPLDFMWHNPFQAPYDSTRRKEDSGNQSMRRVKGVSGSDMTKPRAFLSAASYPARAARQIGR